MGWLIAAVLAVILFRTRRRLKRLTEDSPATLDTETARPRQSAFSTKALSYQHVYDLIVLRLELGRLRATGEMDSARYQQVTEHIDTLWSALMSRLWAVPQSIQWRQGREAAWILLIRHQFLPAELPPWHGEEAADIVLSDEPLSAVSDYPPQVQAQETQADTRAATDLTQPVHLKEAIAHTVDVPPLPAAPSAPPPQPIPAPLPSASTHDQGHTSPSHIAPPSGSEETAHYALEPTRPGRLERALQAVSGWPALFAPFLVQHIGWFIGGFCFVAGSIFLVSYTTGFAKSLTISTVLFAYTLLVLWAGYQLRRGRPALAMSSNVLMTIGVLLVPLNIAAAVRLMHTGWPSPGLIAIGILAAVVDVGGLYMAATLVSGMMDRALQGRHPRIFMALAAMQLTVPVLALLPYWPVLAVLHGVLLVLLAYGLVLFTKEWLHSIFIEQRTIAYYAAGSLVYAGLVSFIHLTWGYAEPLALPHGYYSPFLIVLCGLLFYVDAQLKQWVKHDAFLSRISFAIYGLSMLALCFIVADPTTRILTLCLAIGLYATVTWKYATLPPLYLLLGCSGWLYHTLILHYLPYHWYFLASIPGFAGLFACSRWALRLRSATLALMGYRVLVVSVLGVASWSVLHASPGLVAMGTALVVTGLAFAGLRYIPAPLFGGNRFGAMETPHHRDTTGDMRNSSWLYAGTLAAMIAVAYAPLWTSLTWATQCAFGLVVLAQLWTVLGVRQRRMAREAEGPRVEVLLNSALLALIVFLMVAVASALPNVAANRALPLLLALGGGMMLQLSLGLGVPWLFYGVLLLWGAAGAGAKIIYFPVPGAGTSEMAMILLAWGVLWWMERESAEVRALRRERAELRAWREPPLMLLWRFPVSFRSYRDIIHMPLQQTMVLLGVIGLAHLGIRLLTGSLSWAWVVSASLGALVALLFTGRFRRVWLLPLSLTLGLGAWLVVAFKLGITTSAGLSAIGTIYAFLGWQASIRLLTHPNTLRLARTFHLRGDRALLEQATYWTTSAITMLCLVLPLEQYGLFTPSVSLLIGLITSLVFLWLAGQRYRQRLHPYLLLGIGVLGTVRCYAWAFHASTASFASPWQELLSDSGLGLMLTLISLALWAIALAVTRHLDTSDVPHVNTDAPHAHSLYEKPLRVVAASLALVAAGQQLGLAWPAMLGIGYTGDFLSMAVLCLAGISLLLANHTLGKPPLSLTGMLCVILAMLWTQGVWVHGSPICTMWLGNAVCTDQWLTLAILALGVACLTRYVGRDLRWERLYTQPLRATAGLTYGWALLGAMALFVMLPAQANATLPWVFLTLALALLPLVQTLPAAATIRGIGIALLLTACVTSALASGGWHAFDRFLLVVWAYALWGLGNFGLRRFNARRPHWAIAPDIWPWCGLVVVWMTLLLWGLDGQTTPWGQASRLGWYLTAVACYLFLMLRNSAWTGFSWIAALTLTCAGMAYNVAWLWSPSPILSLPLPVVGLIIPLRFVLGTVVWSNVLLLGVSVWRRYGPDLSVHLGWQQHDLERPLLFWPSACVLLGVLLLAVVDASAILLHTPVPAVTQWASAALLGCILALSCLHMLWLRRNPWSSHVFMVSLLCTLLAVWLGTATHLFHLPLFLALWSVILLAVDILWEKKQWRRAILAPLRLPVSQWLTWSPLVAIVVWGLFPQVSFGERLVTLGILGGIAARLGWQRQHARWLLAAMAILVIQLHSWWLFWVPPRQIALLFPWYALQLAGLTWFVQWLQNWVQHAVEADDGTDDHRAVSTTMLHAIMQALSWLLPPLVVLTLMCWTLHAFYMFYHLVTAHPPQWLLGGGEVVVAVGAPLVLMALGIRRAWQTQRALWVYGVAVLGSALGVYIRMAWIGLAPLQVWDTTALISAAYALFILQRRTASRALSHVVMVLPLLALATVPLSLASSHASGALLSVGMLYLCLRRTTDHRLPLYLGTAALNAGIYLWVPGWAHHYHMVQVYTIPAAISTLWVLHLHRHDVRPSVLHSTRLAAISLLYVSATLDVFLRAELAIFVAALGLSFVGSLIGIALRTRAFLYAGVTFFVLNVVGQLLLLFPTQRLGKAIVLLLLGTLITGGMIWFNAQRETLLQRLRLFRADVATWA